jgi:drug/metabolite transporter (DMT)-like permease
VSLEHPNRQAYIAWIAVCVLWGTTYLGIRIALETIPPALVGGLRFTAAGILMVALLVSRGEPVIRPMQWGGLAVTGILTICVGNGGVIWAEQWVPSGIAAVTVATIPFWMIGIEAFAHDGDPLSTRLVLGLVVGFAGIMALQIACVGWALGSSLSRRHAVRENVMSAAAMQMLFGGLVMLVAATVRDEWRQLAFTPRTVVAELYLTVFGSIIGYSAYTYALRHLPTATVSLYAYANPVIAILLGAVVAGEPFGPRVVVASTMVLIGSALVQGKSDGGVTDRSFRAAGQSRRSLSDWGASDGELRRPGGR